MTISTLQLAPNASLDVPVDFSASSLGGGEYQGFILIESSTLGNAVRVPYWYGVPTGVAQNITILRQKTRDAAGAVVDNAFLLRITDMSGIAIADTPPVITAISGEGRVLRITSRDAFYPGIFSVRVLLGALPGPNVFRIQAGDVTKDITITGF